MGPICPICCEQLICDDTEAWSLKSCGHCYHRSCLEDYISFTRSKPDEGDENNTFSLQEVNLFACSLCRKLFRSVKKVVHEVEVEDNDDSLREEIEGHALKFSFEDDSKLETEVENLKLELEKERSEKVKLEKKLAEIKLENEEMEANLGQALNKIDDLNDARISALVGLQSND